MPGGRERRGENLAPPHPEGYYAFPGPRTGIDVNVGCGAGREAAVSSSTWACALS
ncbi:hypothetical protein ACH4UM_02835 [Streptomyces sp. NPDC020801]|uniref:hypothetical protein n=1 Tax=Streptomyces sp. NPDC020801 TaxID=3365093 RepID=UPI00378F392F